MITKNIRGVDISYFQSEDPVIGILNQGGFFGESNFNMLNYFIKKKSRIIDCGCHIGTFSVPALLAGYKVSAIDGAYKNIECLRQTAKQFKGRLDVFENILSDRVKKCSFSTDSGPFGSLVEDEEGDLTSQTLDNLCETSEYHNICAIKYDLEGGEIDALKGSRETLSKHKPPLLIEVNGHCLLQNKQSVKYLFNVIEDLDYKIYHLINTQHGTIIHSINKDKFFPFCVTDVVCVNNNELHQHEFLKQVKELTDDQIDNTASDNYKISNSDCKKYFDSVM